MKLLKDLVGLRFQALKMVTSGTLALKLTQEVLDSGLVAPVLVLSVFELLLQVRVFLLGWGVLDCL